MAWWASGGRWNPQAKGRALWKAEQKRQKSHACPCPEFAETMTTTVRVADRFYGGRLDLAEEVRDSAPAKFRALLQFANADKEAEPLAMEFAQSEADNKRRHEEEVSKLNR